MNPNDTASGNVTTRFLESMASPDPQIRSIAAGFARRKGAAVLPGLASVATHTDPAIAKGARRAMDEITHYACQPGFGSERAQVAEALLGIARNPARPRTVRAQALHLLGFAGDSAQSKMLVPLETDRELGEDARMARERLQQEK